MRKKYSDPLMFASRSILTSIPITPSQGGTMPDDEEEDNTGNRSVFSFNSNSVPASEDPVAIVNPVEEAVASDSTIAAAESEDKAAASSPLGAESVIDEIVPDAAEEPSGGID